jgi:hypothetical protein
LSLFNKVFKLVEIKGDPRTKMLYYMTYADAYRLNKDYNMAIENLQNALALAKLLHLQNDIEKLQHKIKELQKSTL